MIKAFFTLIIFASMALSSTFSVTNEDLYYIDKSLKKDINEIKNLEFSKRKDNNFGFGRFIVWKKYTIKNNTDKKINFHGVNHRVLMDYVNIYILQDNKVLYKYFLGDKIEATNEYEFSRWLTFYYNLEPKNSVDVYISHRNIKGVVDTNWKFLQENIYHKHQFFDSIFFGLNFGIILLAMFMSCLLFFTTKVKYALIYSGISLLLMIGQLTFYGILHQLNIGIPLEFFSYPEMFFYICIILVIYFHIEFFEIKFYSKKLFRYFKTLAFLMMIIILLDLLVSDENFKIVFISAVILQWIITPSLLISAIKLSIKGYSGGWYYVLAQLIVFLSSQAIIWIMIFNIQSMSTFYYYLNIIGTLIHVIFLSMAIFVRAKENHINSLKKSQAIVELTRFHNSEMIVNNIIHQWKSPLARIISILTNLQAKIYLNKKLEQEEIQKSIKDINTNAIMMSNIVNKFYDFGKEIEKKEFFFKEIYAESLNIFHDEIKTLNAKVNYNVLSQNDKFVSDRFIILNISTIMISNFINIVKHRGIKKPRLNISYLQEDEYVKIFFSDNCKGVDTVPAEKVLEAFNTNSKNPKKGMGLFIARTMVSEKLKGTIKVYNNNDGATFEVIFPFK